LNRENTEDTFLQNLKIAIVTDELNQWGGAENVLQEILKIFPKGDLFTAFITENIRERLFEEGKWSKNQKNWFKGKIFETPLKNKFIRFLDKFLMTFYPFFYETMDLRGYDLVLSVTSRFAKNVILPENATHICYIHTPPRFLWNDWKRYLNDLTGIKKLFVPLAPPFLTKIRQTDFLSAKRVDFFIANSEFTKKRVQKYYRHENIDVLYPPVEVEQFEFSDQKKDFYLIGGRNVAYKKFSLVVEAFNKLELPLKIYGPETDSLKKINTNPNTEFLGSVSNSVRKELFRDAKGFLFPQVEDFGIVPLEAQISGTPVIAFRKGGALENVIENETGIFFDDQSVISIADAVRRFEKMNWNHKKIREHAEKFGTKFFINGLKSKIFHQMNFRKK